MEIITRASEARNLIHRFKSQYSELGEFQPNFVITPKNAPPTTAGAIAERLEALGDTITVEQAETILPGWINLQCDECKYHVNALVRVGIVTDYSGSTAHICPRCLVDALNLAKLATTDDRALLMTLARALCEVFAQWWQDKEAGK
jgi:hypothetical protein